jgi:hypothetical protein
LIVFAIPFLVASTIFLPLQRVILSPTTYQTALMESDLYEGIPADIAGLLQDFIIADEPTQDLVDLFSPPTTQNTLIKIFTPFLDVAWIDQQIGGALRAMIAFVNGKNDQLSVTIDLRPLKDRFSGAYGQSALAQVIHSLPVCDPQADMADMEMYTNFFQTGTFSHIPNCLTAEVMEDAERLNAVVSQLNTQIRQLVNLISDEFVLVSAPETQKAAQAVIPVSFFQLLRTCRLALVVSPILAVICLLILGIIKRKNIRSLLTWLGIPLMIAGLLGILINLTMYLLGNGLLGEYGWQSLTGIPKGLAISITAIVYRITNEYVLYASYTALGMLAIGFLCYLGAKTIKTSVNKQPD